MPWLTSIRAHSKCYTQVVEKSFLFICLMLLCRSLIALASQIDSLIKKSEFSHACC